jgi:hypothetical protein
MPTKIGSDSIGSHALLPSSANTANTDNPQLPGRSASSLAQRNSGSMLGTLSNMRATQSDRLSMPVIELDEPMSPELGRSPEHASATLLRSGTERSNSLAATRGSSSRSSLTALRSITDSLRRTAPSGPMEPPRLSTSSIEETTAITIPNVPALAAELRAVFEPHIHEGNREAFEALIANRAAALDAKGETPTGLRAVLSKGLQFDRASQGTVGFVRSVPFGIASRAFDAIPALTSFAKTPAQVGAVVGAGSGVTDTVGGSLLNRATRDTQWLDAEPGKLEPEMAQAQEAARPSMKRVAAEVSAAFQTYTLRNVGRTVVGPLVTKTHGALTAANVDSWLAATGGPVAGAAAYLALHQINTSAHRSGPEYLLGRTDWETHYDALKDATWGTQLKGAAKRAVHLPIDIATDALSAARNVFTATNVVKNAGALGGGFAGVLAGKTAATKAAQHLSGGAAAVSAVGQAVNTVLSAPVYATWTAVDVMGPSLIDKAVGRLQSHAQAPAQPTAANAGDTAHVAIDIDAPPEHQQSTRN